MNVLDRMVLAVAPVAGLRRLQARRAATIVQRHFEAAEIGRRTAHWRRPNSDANAVVAGKLGPLRYVSRDLIRNNSWGRRGRNSVAGHMVGWGITPDADGPAAKLWEKWGETTQCDARGRHDFYGLQKLVARTVFESGECLIRRRLRRVDDGLEIPLQLQVIEPDYLDIARDGVLSGTNNTVIQGVEFDAVGRRVAYWMFKDHPGSLVATKGFNPTSYRVPADQVLHVYLEERPGQERGIPWLVSAILKLKDLDEFEDATLMKQKIAACFAVFVTDPEGSASPLGPKQDQAADDDEIDTLEPGMIEHMPPGKTIESASPPSAGDFDPLSKSTLRNIAAGIGITYEALTGDYSNVNYSSGRLGRIEMQQNVHDWQYDMLIPQFCAPAWDWAMGTAVGAGSLKAIPPTSWTPPPFPMVDPEKDARGNILQVRSGQKDPFQMIREQGYQPKKFLARYAEALKMLDDLGITLDIDARQRTQVGNAVTAGSDAADTTNSG